MTPLHDLTAGDLRRLVRYLSQKRDELHLAARWLLLFCCLEAIVILGLLVR